MGICVWRCLGGGWTPTSAIPLFAAANNLTGAFNTNNSPSVGKADNALFEASAGLQPPVKPRPVLAVFGATLCND